MLERVDAAYGTLTEEELEAAYCWEPGDLVPGRPAMTDYRRALRYHQARWREAKGHPIGSQPIVPREGKPSRPVGSRLPLDYARQTGATFVTAGGHEAAKARTSIIEPHQTLDHQRLWAELMWSPTLGFNLFGDLAVDHALADRAVHTWWPDAPGVVTEVRFAHSPGRLDPAYLNSLRAFDAAFVLDVGDGRNAIVGVDTRYYDWTKPETPRPDNMWRYLEVAERSGAFRPGATGALEARSELCVLWLEHLLSSRCFSTRVARGRGADMSSSTPLATRTTPRRVTATGGCSATSRRSPPSPWRSSSTRKPSRRRPPRPWATGTCPGTLEFVAPEEKLETTDCDPSIHAPARRTPAGVG